MIPFLFFPEPVPLTLRCSAMLFNLPCPAAVFILRYLAIWFYSPHERQVRLFSPRAAVCLFLAVLFISAMSGSHVYFRHERQIHLFSPWAASSIILAMSGTLIYFRYVRQFFSCQAQQGCASTLEPTLEFLWEREGRMPLVKTAFWPDPRCESCKIMAQVFCTTCPVYFEHGVQEFPGADHLGLQRVSILHWGGAAQTHGGCSPHPPPRLSQEG